MEFSESLLLLSFLLLHRRDANPIHFPSYPSNTTTSSVPSIFIKLPARSILFFFYNLVRVEETYFPNPFDFNSNQLLSLGFLHNAQIPDNEDVLM